MSTGRYSTIWVEWRLVMDIDEQELAKVIGNAIAKRRKASNLTQEEVAEHLNIGNEAVSRMERGTVMPTISRLVELAEIFNCSAGELLVESSNSSVDQEKIIASLISKLSKKNRAFILDIVERLSSHLK